SKVGAPNYIRTGEDRIGELRREHLCTLPQAKSKDFAETEQEHTGEYNHEHSYDDVKYAASQVHLWNCGILIVVVHVLCYVTQYSAELPLLHLHLPGSHPRLYSHLKISSYSRQPHGGECLFVSQVQLLQGSQQPVSEGCIGNTERYVPPQRKGQENDHNNQHSWDQPTKSHQDSRSVTACWKRH